MGLDAGAGRYVLFIDDDVVIPPNILHAYLAAIREEPDAPGYVGPTVFPDPVNSFTRGDTGKRHAHFFRAAHCPPAHVVGNHVKPDGAQNAIGNVRFSEAFPKARGWEDIDFCLRIVSDSGKWFRTVPGARVSHPWWKGAGRSYTAVLSLGGGRFQPGAPACHNTCIETFQHDRDAGFGTAALGCAALVAWAVPPAMVGIWVGLVVCSEFAIEQARVRVNHPGLTMRGRA